MKFNPDYLGVDIYQDRVLSCTLRAVTTKGLEVLAFMREGKCLYLTIGGEDFHLTDRVVNHFCLYFPGNLTATSLLEIFDEAESQWESVEKEIIGNHLYEWAD